MRTGRKMRDRLAMAKNRAAKAKAHFAFALFHDNNSREADAIPHYRAALALALPRETAAQAWAYLASSLWKTGKSASALVAARRALAMTRKPLFRAWVERLIGRITRSMR